MSQSLTDWLQQSRLMVVSFDKDKGLLRVKSSAEVCTDLSCDEKTVVVADEGATGDLAGLNPGDIIKVDSAAGRPERIVVVRRVWEELASPEL